ncbi:MAG: hypothetical protein GXP35_09475 [Actinobacteria bacterium]|nr:hypothetical protein [Actinomycetota bacterium]
MSENVSGVRVWPAGEAKANRTGNPINDVVFPDGDFTPSEGVPARPYADLRWKNFKNQEPGGDGLNETGPRPNDAVLLCTEGRDRRQRL